MEKGLGEGEGILPVVQAFEKASMGPLDGPEARGHLRQFLEMPLDRLSEHAIRRAELEGAQEAEALLPPGKVAAGAPCGADEGFTCALVSLEKPAEEGDLAQSPARRGLCG